ncbi:hypothetical protein [Methanoplanus limicola]|nr:hypothetical protein [Methanoplanus limicola]
MSTRHINAESRLTNISPLKYQSAAGHPDIRIRNSNDIAIN